jgi:hypothetical protein
MLGVDLGSSEDESSTAIDSRDEESEIAAPPTQQRIQQRILESTEDEEETPTVHLAVEDTEREEGADAPTPANAAAFNAAKPAEKSTPSASFIGGTDGAQASGTRSTTDDAMEALAGGDEPLRATPQEEKPTSAAASPAAAAHPTVHSTAAAATPAARLPARAPGPGPLPPPPSCAAKSEPAAAEGGGDSALPGTVVGASVAPRAAPSRPRVRADVTPSHTSSLATMHHAAGGTALGNARAAELQLVVDAEREERRGDWYVISAAWLSQWHDWASASDAGSVGAGAGGGGGRATQGGSTALPALAEQLHEQRARPGPIDNMRLFRNRTQGATEELRSMFEPPPSDGGR